MDNHIRPSASGTAPAGESSKAIEVDAATDRSAQANTSDATASPGPTPAAIAALAARIEQWCYADDDAEPIEFICETILPALKGEPITKGAEPQTEAAPPASSFQSFVDRVTGLERYTLDEIRHACDEMFTEDTYIREDLIELVRAQRPPAPDEPAVIGGGGGMPTITRGPEKADPHTEAWSPAWRIEMALRVLEGCAIHGDRTQVAIEVLRHGQSAGLSGAASPAATAPPERIECRFDQQQCEYPHCRREDPTCGKATAPARCAHLIYTNGCPSCHAHKLAATAPQREE